MPQRHAGSVTPLSNSDPSQAPEGGSLAYVDLPGIAVDAREGWSPELKDRTMKSVIDHMSEFYEGFESEVGRFVETAREREKRLNVTNGCVTHIDFGAFARAFTVLPPALAVQNRRCPDCSWVVREITPAGGFRGFRDGSRPTAHCVI